MSTRRQYLSKLPYLLVGSVKRFFERDLHVFKKDLPGIYAKDWAPPEELEEPEEPKKSSKKERKQAAAKEKREKKQQARMQRRK